MMELLLRGAGGLTLVLFRIGHGLRACARAVAREGEYQRAIARLERLEDWRLQDIGLDRAQIEQAVRRGSKASGDRG